MVGLHNQRAPRRATGPRRMVTVMWHTQKKLQNKPIVDRLGQIDNAMVHLG